MTRASVLPPEAAAYLDELREQLADLPPEERDDVLEEVEASLIEAAEEGEAAVPTRLGSPSRFAAELRAAAGLASAPPALPAPGTGARLLAAVRRLQSHPRVGAALRVLRELAPVWWLVRAYVAVAGIALVAGSSWSISHPEVPLYGGPVLGSALLLVLAAASIASGMRTRRVATGSRTRRSAAALNVVLAATAVPVAAHIANHPARVQYIPYAMSPYDSSGPRELIYKGRRVRNIYPYGRDGHLLQDVRLFDDAGRAIAVGSLGVRDPLRRKLFTALGTPILNSFPIRYFEPHTRRVAHPDAGARPHVSAITTPPLRPRDAAVRRGPSAAPARAVGGASAGPSAP